MSLFRKRAKEEQVTEIPISTIERWALYDLGLENPNG
jgi:hypothetical protein